MLGQQSDREHEQIVEIDAVGALQLDIQLAPHGRDQRRRSVPRVLLVAIGGQQPVLRQRDLREHLAGGGLSVIGERLLDPPPLLI